jgi:7,8-dihydropterin-6-yl-methyl-4-(beta-D-ribofuranosyl)aminobenzene 5'-phosphate synthase
MGLSMRRLIVSFFVLLVVLLVAGLGAVHLRHQAGLERTRESFLSYVPPRMGAFGATRSLAITPLVDYHTTRDDLIGEVGLSYLIETDTNRILFDVGHNAKAESPSPLERNMETLGIERASIDTVFISHNHLDHVGGPHRQQANSFSLGNEQTAFTHPQARAIVPVAMTYPGLTPIPAQEPMRLGEGVATTGTIPRQLVIGVIDEQSLAVNVEDLGVVLIVGCGHQPIPNLLRRYDQLFDEPLYGIIGGLHLPVPQGRLQMAGLDVQRVFASGDGPFAPLTMIEIEEQVAMLQARNLGVIGVGGHDSSDEVIALFAREFGDAYRYVRVGEPIEVGPR